MGKKEESRRVCAVCGNLFSGRNLTPGEAVRDAISKEIQLDLLSELGRGK